MNLAGSTFSFDHVQILKPLQFNKMDTNTLDAFCTLHFALDSESKLLDSSNLEVDSELGNLPLGEFSGS